MEKVKSMWGNDAYYHLRINELGIDEKIISLGNYSYTVTNMGRGEVDVDVSPHSSNNLEENKFVLHFNFTYGTFSYPMYICHYNDDAKVVFYYNKDMDLDIHKLLDCPDWLHNINYIPCYLSREHMCRAYEYMKEWKNMLMCVSGALDAIYECINTAYERTIIKEKNINDKFLNLFGLR